MSAWMSPPDAAKELGCDPGKILSWVKSGELRAVNLATRASGRPRWRIRREDFERFLEARSSRPPEPTPKRRRKQASDSVIPFYT